MTDGKWRVWMVGPAEHMPGGMNAVVASYRDAGLADHVRLRYLSSYEGAGALRQLKVFSGAFVKLSRALLCGEVDLLHVHSASRGSFWRKSLLCALARAFNVPYVFHLHSGEFVQFYERECGPLRRRWIRRTLRGSAAMLVLSAGWQQRLTALIPGLCCVCMPNPIALPCRTQCSAEGANLLFLGRIREKKGVFDLLRAFPYVLARVPSARLRLAGDGELARARALAEELGVSANVDLLDWIDGERKQKELAGAALFVLPSYFEGVPIGVLEAMAMEVPVIATRVGGIPDIVQDGSEALLSDAGDVAALARNLVLALTDQPRRQALTAAAYERVQAHEQGRVVVSLLALYGRVVASPKRGQA